METEGEIPIRLGEDGEFSLVRAFFEKVGFAQDRVCAALNIPGPVDMSSLDWSRVVLDAIPPDLRWCIEVFIGGAATPAGEAHAACDAQTLAAMESLGLLRFEADTVVSSVWACPVDGFVVASDRYEKPDGTDIAISQDVVFPAVHVGTLTLLHLLPQVHDGDAIDLGGGTGIVAMRAGRSGNRAVTSDITLRAQVFAEFNSRLNDVAIESLRGDMYGAVEGRQFDLITMHAPYVPSVSGSKIFADGGKAGEELIQRFIEGLPTFLRPGGIAALLSAGRDTQEAPYERRAREWLGAAAEEFDIAFGLEAVMPLENVADALRRTAPEAEVQATLQWLRDLGTKHFAYGLLTFRRYSERVTHSPVRMQMVRDVTPGDFERLFAWRARHRLPDFADFMAHAKPRPAPEAEFVIRHIVQGERLAAKDHNFSISRGFRTALGIEPFVVPLLMRLDGSRSVANVFEAAQQAGELPENSHLRMFIGLVAVMVERGLLVVG
jgi:methylase of polypeptide subunit release factors